MWLFYKLWMWISNYNSFEHVEICNFYLNFFGPIDNINICWTYSYIFLSMVAILHLLESSFTFISMQTLSMAIIVISLDFYSTFTTMLALVMATCFVSLGFGSIFIAMLFNVFDIRISTLVHNKFRNFWRPSCTLSLNFDMFFLKWEKNPSCKIKLSESNHVGIHIVMPLFFQEM